MFGVVQKTIWANQMPPLVPLSFEQYYILGESIQTSLSLVLLVNLLMS